MLPFLRGLPLTAMMFFVILPPFSSDTPLLYHFYGTSRIRPSKDFNGQPRGNSCGRKFLHSYFQNGGSAKKKRAAYRERVSLLPRQQKGNMNNVPAVPAAGKGMTGSLIPPLRIRPAVFYIPWVKRRICS